MNKFLKKFVSLALAATLFILPGCQSQNKGGREFVNINGVSFTENELYYNLYYSIGSSYLGILEYDETADINTIKKAINDLEKNEEYADYVKKQKIAFVKQKVCDQGLLAVAQENNVTLTEEEQKQVDDEYQSVVDFFNSEDTLTQIKEQFYADTDNADAKAKDYLAKYKTFFLNIYAVSTIEELKDKFTNLAIINKVLENKADEVPDDEEYVKNFYNQLVESQKKDYTEDPSYFDTDYDYGEIICYYPSGLRYVKHILIKFSDADQEKLIEYETKISELEEKENRTAEEEQTLSNTKTEMQNFQNQMDVAAKQKADDVYSKIQAGTDFDTALKAYGEDASMTDEDSAYAKKGYLIHESSDFVEEFLTVAMALKNVGDISKPVKSSYGYHIIKYVEKGREGVVPYEEIRDEILTVAMEDKRQEQTTKYYDTVYDNLMSSGQVNVNYEVLGIDQNTYNTLYQEMMSVVTEME